MDILYSRYDFVLSGRVNLIFLLKLSPRDFGQFGYNPRFLIFVNKTRLKWIHRFLA
jgi:hypothetical protein